MVPSIIPKELISVINQMNETGPTSPPIIQTLENLLSQIPAELISLINQMNERTTSLTPSLPHTHLLKLPCPRSLSNHTMFLRNWKMV